LTAIRGDSSERLLVPWKSATNGLPRAPSPLPRGREAVDGLGRWRGAGAVAGETRARMTRAHPGPRRLVAAVVLLLTAAACTRPGDDAIVLDFWAMGREGEMVDRLVPAFERQVPGVRVRVQQVPWSAAHEKLLTAYVGGVMPDVIQAGSTWLPELATVGALEPLDTRIAASAAVDAGDYFAGAHASNAIAGRTYGLPWYVDTRVLFYRSDLLRAVGYEEAPRTWETWLAAMTRLKRRAGADGYAILLPLTEWETPVILALQRGARLLRDDDRYGDFRSPAFRDALAFYRDLFTRDLAPRAGAAQVANVYQDFARGYFAFYVTGPWNLGEFERRLPEDLDDRWTTAPLPGPDGAAPGISLAGGASLAIAATSRHKDAAWRWIEYLSAPAREIEFYRLTGDLPPRARAWEDAGLVHGARTRAFWTQLQHVGATPKIPEWERIAAKVGDYVETVVRGRMDVDAAVAALDGDVDAILEKRRWLLDHDRLPRVAAAAAQGVGAGARRARHAARPATPDGAQGGAARDGGGGRREVGAR
jgi:multiple sugar transport system substrate-binding protein